jgi:hypothetical protein
MNSMVEGGITLLRDEGVVPLLSHSAIYLNQYPWNTATSRHPIGTNVFDMDWDLLIVLDACRADALRALAAEVPFIDDVGQRWSLGSMSAEWMLNTFHRRRASAIEKTGYISCNSWSDRIFVDRVHENPTHEYRSIRRGWPAWNPVSAESFGHYELVKEIANHAGMALHSDSNVVHHIATDRAIAMGRESNLDRMIVHYLSPHLKYIAGALDWSPGICSIGELMRGPRQTRPLKPEERSFRPAKVGEVTRGEVFEMYQRELRFVLDYVGILLQNYEAETVLITADHGEALGELGVWGHPFGWPHPAIRTVPVVATTAADEQTYSSHFSPLDRSPTEQEHKTFLVEMGYL